MTDEQSIEHEAENTNPQDMPEMPETKNGTSASEEVARLETALGDMQAKAQEYLDGWQRERAEFANYKKRATAEIQDARRSARLDMIEELLPIIDDFELAEANVPDELIAFTWLDGFNLIKRKFRKLLDDNGVEILDPVGKPFDPSLHEAVGVDTSSNAESGQVTQTLRKGYIQDGRVLRTALVRVAG